MKKQSNVKAIINANVVLETGIIWDGVIILEGDKIREVGAEFEVTIPEGAEIIDANGKYVGPGFVDIHVHEGNGVSTNEEPVKAAEFFLKHGTTSMLATPFYAMDFDRLMKAFKTIKENMPLAKTIKGIYSEGPYTHPDFGAHAYMNPWKGPIDLDKMRALVDEAVKDVKVWTIGPEREDIIEFVKYAREVNPDVVYAESHSKASPAHIRALGKYRPTLETHSMCATGLTEVPGATRGVGPDQYCFKEPDMYAELISDYCGLHVHAEMQQLLLHTKGVHRVVLVTDSTVRPNPVPEEFKHVPDINFNPHGQISGSKLTMDQACRNIMKHTNCGIAQAFIMASLNPAKVIGLDHEIGSIAVGKVADLVFVDDRFNVDKVMLGGEMCSF